MKEIIDLRSNGPAPEPKQEMHIVEQELSSGDIIKLMKIFGCTIAACVLIICAYLAGVLHWLFVLVGFFGFLIIMIKGTE